jgi:hypothetical protein
VCRGLLANALTWATHATIDLCAWLRPELRPPDSVLAAALDAAPSTMDAEMLVWLVGAAASRAEALRRAAVETIQRWYAAQPQPQSAALRCGGAGVARPRLPHVARQHRGARARVPGQRPGARVCACVRLHTNGLFAACMQTSPDSKHGVQLKSPKGTYCACATGEGRRVSMTGLRKQNAVSL